jgi:hypothetical protein
MSVHPILFLTNSASEKKTLNEINNHEQQKQFWNYSADFSA